MGFTFTEKVLAKAAGLEYVKADQMVEVEPDLFVMYGWEGLSNEIVNIVEKEIGQIIDGEKLVIFTDHKIPATSIKEQNFHLKTINWAKKRKARVYPRAIGHQILVEIGLANPGDIVVHFDRHVNMLGALGIFAVGTRLELIMSLATGKFGIQIPKTVCFNLKGQFQPGVMGRDLIHRIVGDIGPDGAFNQVVEFSGSGIKNVCLDSRLTICCLAMFIGATTAIFSPDDITFEYYKNHFSRKVNLPSSDSNCDYEKIIEYDLSDLEPQLVKPPKPQDTLPLRDFIGTRVQQGYIGSCASGRLEDLSIAAQILRGRKIADEFRLYVIPSSAKIMAEAARLGYLEQLIEAGAWISSPTCDFCYGRTQVLADDEVAISTGTLNVPGRMGNVNSEIYIGSAASVAAAAVSGSIDDPRNFL